MRTIAMLPIAGLLALAGCGEGDQEPAPPQTGDAAVERDAGADAAGDDAGKAAAEDAGDEATAGDGGGQARRRAAGTRLRVRGSEFGRMLFDSKRQAIYIFERDPKGRSVCYGECAEAWPPVLTNRRPVAGKGVRARLLGTFKRRGGRRQVTYAGQPLYYYAHEARGEVRCHNVNLNGGFWWVVGPDGARRP